MKDYTICKENGDIIGVLAFEVQPPFSSEKMYQGGFVHPKLNFVTDVFYESATASEVTAYQNAKEDAEDLAEHLLLEEKGAELIYRTKKRLIRRFKKGLITKPQAKKVREILNPIFQFLKTGDLDIANDKAILLPIETNSNIQGELTWFKERLLEIQ